jgi:predicted Zn-dependent protease
VLRGSRQARLESDDITPDGVRNLVDNAITAVNMLSEADIVLPLPPLNQTQSNITNGFTRYDPTTANLTPDGRSKAIKTMIDVAKAHKLECAGIVSTGTQFTALANSNGMFLTHTESMAECSVTMAAKNSTGWSKSITTNIQDVDAHKLAEEAAQKAELSADPKEAEPGHYTVILPPSGVLNLLIYMWSEFTGTSHVDKLSSLLGKVGEKIFGDNVNVVDDVFHPLQTGAPFDGEGIPRQKVVLIKNGVVENLIYGRRSAHKMGAKPTGHGMSEPSPTGEFPMNVVMQGGTSTTEDMIKSTERGILLSRVWYVRVVEPTTVLLTGMTRDGTFVIEDGKLKHGIKNMRFNVSMHEMLNNILELGPAIRTSGDEDYPSVVPSMKVANFNFSSTTKF